MHIVYKFLHIVECFLNWIHLKNTKFAQKNPNKINLPVKIKQCPGIVTHTPELFLYGPVDNLWMVFMPHSC